MWNEVYSFNVPDLVKQGKAVRAIDLSSEFIDVINVSGITIKRFFELQQSRNVIWYVKEEKNGEPDGTDE